MAREAANRRYDKRHEDRPFHDGTERRWAKEYSASTPFHYRDGVTVWVSEHDLTPADNFLGDLDEITPETLGALLPDQPHDQE